MKDSQRGVTGLALTLIEEYAHDLRRALTINQLAKACGKPYPNVHAAVKTLLADGILTKEIVGHAHNCRLDLANPRTAIYLAIAQSRKPRAPLPQGADGAILVWKRDTDCLLVTPAPAPAAPGTHAITLDAFLADKELFATIGKHTLLKGHGTYASILETHAREALR